MTKPIIPIKWQVLNREADFFFFLSHCNREADLSQPIPYIFLPRQLLRWTTSTCANTTHQSSNSSFSAPKILLNSYNATILKQFEILTVDTLDQKFCIGAKSLYAWIPNISYLNGSRISKINENKLSWGFLPPKSRESDIEAAEIETDQYYSIIKKPKWPASTIHKQIFFSLFSFLLMNFECICPYYR